MQNRSVSEIIESLGIRRLSSTPHGYKGCCDINPDHYDSKPSMHIHFEKGIVKCFSCGAFKTLFDYLIEKGATFEEAVDFLFTDFFSEKRMSEGMTEWVLGRDIPASMIKRGFLVSTLKHFGVGYDAHPDNRHITIPMRYNGVLYGIKYRQPNKKFWYSEGFVKDNFVYNYEPTEERYYVEGECYDGETEIFTENGWIKFAGYVDGTKIHQVNDDFTTTLVEPYKVVRKKYSGNMVSFSNSKKTYRSFTTENHNIVGVKRHSNIPEKRFAKNGFPSNYNIQSTVKYYGSAGTGKSLDELSLMLAISADATIRERNTEEFNYAYFNLKKERKKLRLIDLLTKLKIEYVTHESTTRVGYTDISFRIPKEYSKLLPKSWELETTIQEREQILREVQYWDGHSNPNKKYTEYYTTLEHNAKLIHSIAHLTGFRASIYSRKSGKGYDSITHRVNILWDTARVSWANIKKEIIPVEDFMVYCVSVKSGMVLVRKDGIISVNGNTDTWRTWQNGTKNVSALLTAYPTDGQLQLMSQHKKINLALDNDLAGFVGAFRTNKELGRDLEINVVPFMGKDAGEQTSEAWQRATQMITTFTEFEVEMISRNPELYDQIQKKIR